MQMELIAALFARFAGLAQFFHGTKTRIDCKWLSVVKVLHFGSGFASNNSTFVLFLQEEITSEVDPLRLMSLYNNLIPIITSAT